MSQIWPAVLYLIFTVSWLMFGFFFKLQEGAEMFQSSVQPMLTTPWSVNPFKTIFQVQGPLEVYEWLTKVYVNQLYMEFPVPGDRSGYCTQDSRCLLAEGDTDRDDQCAPNLVAGASNCPGSLGRQDSDCCEACRGDCNNFTAPLTNAQPVSTAVLDLSANCADDMPSWLQELDQWNRAERDTGQRPSTATNVVFCPERISKVQSSIVTREASKGRTLTVGQYNRVLMARFSMKRVRVVPHQSQDFRNAYASRVDSDYTDAYSYIPSAENTDRFGRDTMYSYQLGKGFSNAGGFVSFLTFDKAKDEVLREIANLKANYWFDLNQGSFVVEMLLFNGNVDRFLYVSFTFQHDFSGQTQVSQNVQQLDLSLHNFSQPLTYVRFVLYIAILLLFCIFVKSEVDDMTADYATYFSNFMLLVHCFTLVLSAVCIVQYFVIVFSYPFINFVFPMSEDLETRQQDFEDLVNLANSMGDFMLIISLNICLVLCRLITLMVTVIPQSGVIFNTFARMKYYVVAFFVMMMIMIFGSAMAGYFLFGTRLEAYSTMTKAFLSTMRLLQREVAREGLLSADNKMGNIYFVVFHIFFLIIMQLLVSVLIFGYVEEKERSRILDVGDAYPLKKVWRTMTTYLRRYTNWLFRWFVSLQSFLFDVQGGPTARPNWEQITRLRDRRPTKPRIRNVDYGQIRDGEADDVDIATDVKLKAVYPWYPDGMMHYYVEDLKPEGPAQEFKVQKSAFRLVAIQRQGDERDRKKFRTLEAYEREFNKDPQQLLREAQKSRWSSSVTLEFEGGVTAVSKECVLLLFFIGVFFLFSTQVCRVEDSYSMTVVHQKSLVDPQWYEYNPTRIMSLTKMDAVNTIEQWVQNAILDREYQCVTSLSGGGEDCQTSNLADQTRPDWMYYAEGFTPYAAAANGASIAYVPRVQSVYPPIDRTSQPINLNVRMREYNIGVMANNHVRLTVQVACFRDNPNTRWQPGYSFQLNPVHMRSNCADQPCMDRMVSLSDTCLNFQGEQRLTAGFTGESSKVEYRFTKEGTYGGMGGVAIGMGVTRAEGNQVLDKLKEDRFFRQDVSSFVFEFVNYNSNFDLFAYTQVKFSLKGTGKLEHEVVTSVFPLNIFSQGVKGSGPNWVLVCQVSFAFYIIAVILFTAYFCWDLSIQYFITVNLSRKWYYFFFDFFLEDWWNFVDLVSLILNIVVIEHVFNYMLIGGSILFTRDGIRSWTLDYTFPTMADDTAVDPFRNFGRVGEVYALFSGLAGVNGLFLMLRLLKYLNGLTALRLVMTAISSAINELAVMTLVFLIMLLSFMCMFNFRYGIQYERYTVLSSAGINLFLFLNGRFDVDDLIAATPLYFAMVFTIFQVMFILITNMFLAAIVYRWKDTRRDAQEVTILGALQKLKEPFALSVLSFDKSEKQESQLVKLDAEFWQKLSVLRHIAHLDESGRINLKDESRRRRRGDAEKVQRGREDGEGSESEASSEPDGGAAGGRFNFEKEDDRKRFLKVFKKAHMEIASQMSRSVVVPKNDDIGAGVGALENDETPEEEEEEAEPEFEDDSFPLAEMVGIIEEPQAHERAVNITKTMTEKLEESEHPAEEIWLDALVTVLEEAGSLERLQRFFRPLPMIKPTKPPELLNFKQKKAKMECRLNMFFRWLQEEARIKHYEYLKRMAQDKEKNLKQQSLVLTDYLETLDEQIVNLEKEIKVLERKNAHMRAHVSPLL